MCVKTGAASLEEPRAEPPGWAAASCWLRPENIHLNYLALTSQGVRETARAEPRELRAEICCRISAPGSGREEQQVDPISMTGSTGGFQPRLSKAAATQLSPPAPNCFHKCFFFSPSLRKQNNKEVCFSKIKYTYA